VGQSAFGQSVLARVGCPRRWTEDDLACGGLFTVTSEVIYILSSAILCIPKMLRVRELLRRDGVEGDVHDGFELHGGVFPGGGAEFPLA